MTCEAYKTECCHLPRRICHACGCQVRTHDKWFFDETAGGKPRHRHCRNPQSYISGEQRRREDRAIEIAIGLMIEREHESAMEDLVGSH